MAQKIRSDTDGLYYDADDLEWLCEPDEFDPGILGPKSGAKPVADRNCQNIEEIGGGNEQ